jgi:hypothetical protein
LGKAVGAAADEAGKGLGGLFNRLFGPAADEIGQALGRIAAYRVGNWGRIVEKAQQKSAESSGIVNPRVAFQLLDDGSLCDDEIMVEYLSGLLAGSRSNSGRDDRAIVWGHLVTGLSSLQIRGHFILYREWAGLLHKRIEFNPTSAFGLQQAQLHVDADEFTTAALHGEEDLTRAEVLHHVVPGLARAGLIANRYAWGDGTESRFDAFDRSLRVNPTPQGMELYGWAQGMSGLTPAKFVHHAKIFAEDVVSRLTSPVMPMMGGGEWDEENVTEAEGDSHTNY